MNPGGRPSQLLAWLAGHGLEGDRGLQTFRRYPNLAGCSIERKLEPAVGFVKEKLGLSDVAVAKVRRGGRGGGGPPVCCSGVRSCGRVAWGDGMC